jgi:hypothetical protein
MKKHRNPCPECGRRGKPNNIGIYSCEHCLTWWTKPVIEEQMNTESKKIKEGGMELSDLFLWALGIGAVIQLIIQIILWP